MMRGFDDEQIGRFREGGGSYFVKSFKNKKKCITCLSNVNDYIFVK